ncbi:MAG TPA: DUF4864 domain-containing protein [Alphaproteobacteria bacterium]|nr:DUF4864 domain-containing protein [Paracoccaceae bacterium]RCL78894.1 MAG: DUF4864 domain-containing protein [SAR116 cluster bacterium]HCJ62326.1 DUF4864 domain-containing protein [Alphaproteobacteria bacterium]HCY48386.1 DUF4864 domain-containing protein [Alphaproteobacteria bacterium]|tara:strand:- start:1003 stop:1410 length:408 start_codon:yes stop_codon:yes gene_type:complete
MRFVFSICMLIMLGQSEVRADERSSAIQEVITNQISAFLSDDVDKAYGFASSNIKKVFPSPQSFGRMVQNGYPMIWRPESFEFLELREGAEDLFQGILITDSEDAKHIIIYQMAKEQGAWKIDGVRVRSLPAKSI